MITRRRMIAAAGGLAALAAFGPEPVGADDKSTAPINRSEESMEIKRNGSQPSGKGPTEYFTGDVLCERHLRAQRPDSLAYASAGADADRHSRLRPGAALGRSHRGDPAGRRGLDFAR